MTRVYIGTYIPFSMPTRLLTHASIIHLTFGRNATVSTGAQVFGQDPNYLAFT